MSKVFTYELTVLEHHLDTFGHVNHAVYLEMLEEARWDLITKGGWDLNRVQANQIGPVVLEANIKYRKELKLRERIKIETVCTGYRHRIGLIDHVLYNEKGEKACLASLKFGLFDLKNRTLLEPNEDWLRAVGYID